MSRRAGRGREAVERVRAEGFGLGRPGDRDALNACAGMRLFLEEMLRRGGTPEDALRRRSKPE